MKGLWIVWSTNVGGELCRAFVPEGDSESEALITMIRDFGAGELHDGDVISIVASDSASPETIGRP